MKRLLLALCLGGCGVAVAALDKVVYREFPETRSTEVAACAVTGGVSYVVEGGYQAESFSFGALIGLRADLLDAGGRILSVRESSVRDQRVTAIGCPRKLSVRFAAETNAASVRVCLVAAGNPVTFSPLPCSVCVDVKEPLFPGVYDPEDPPPPDRAKALAELAAVPPATVRIVRKGDRMVALVDGRPMPYNQYKGFTDYRQMGECGADLVVTHNRGTLLFRSVWWDKAVRDEQTGVFDFTRIEETLLRIYNANPRSRVVLSVNVDPDRAFLEAHPDTIFVNEQGVRGRTKLHSFRGFDPKPLGPEECWAYSYLSKAWQAYAEDGLRRLCAYLKSTPAGNIVIGFQLAGGMDGQFVQWQYGKANGHFDYSAEGLRALRGYLCELYGTDAALQQAWGDPSVTFETACNPTAAEFHSKSVFDDKPGFGRRLADCRRFVPIGAARALNGFGKVLREEFGRPCVLSSWYTSTIWSQVGRLAIDELTKDGNINTIVTVSDYAPNRRVDNAGASADNSIAGLTLRNLLYVQEMDHRTWRTQHTGGWMAADSVAMPSDERTFASQIRRDAASVLAAGGTGFHLYDMFGSWYHGEQIRPALKEIFALNRFATDHAGQYPHSHVAIFCDEKARLLRDDTCNNLDTVWRTSGVVPAIHYLSDIDNPALPDYDLAIVWQPITITAEQVTRLRSRMGRKGKVLAIVGEAGTASRDFAGMPETMAQFGLQVRHTDKGTDESVRPAAAGGVLTEDLTGLLGTAGAIIRNGALVRRSQPGHATVDDSAAETLGTWERSGAPAFVRKPMDEGTLVFLARDAGLTPQLLNNLACCAGIRPWSKPGNAVYVGNGVACVHSLGYPVELDFGEKMRLVDFVKQLVSEPIRLWQPNLLPGESAAVGYMP